MQNSVWKVCCSSLEVNRTGVNFVKNFRFSGQEITYEPAVSVNLIKLK